jgi:hypothetical protein
MLPHTILILAAIFSAVTAHAGTWSLKQRNDQRIVEAAGAAAVGDVRVNAFLSLSCNKTGATVARLDCTISDADNVTNVFDLRPFEGPYAPAQARALVSVELEGGSPAQPLLAHASGWMSAEHPGGFGFGVGGRPNESKALSRLIKRMGREGTLLRIGINSFTKPQRTIVAEFPLAGSREALAALADSCR